MYIIECKWECDARYVGRTSRSLSDTIKQHIPTSIRNWTAPLRQQPKRDCKKNNLVSYYSAIGKHLLSNISHCADSYSEDIFRFIKQCHSFFQLRIMEFVLIQLTNPVLCRHKDYVFNLSLLLASSSHLEMTCTLLDILNIGRF